jgi:hypothetical protein
MSLSVVERADALSIKPREESRRVERQPELGESSVCDKINLQSSREYSSGNCRSLFVVDGADAFSTNLEKRADALSVNLN